MWFFSYSYRNLCLFVDKKLRRLKWIKCTRLWKNIYPRGARERRSHEERLSRAKREWPSKKLFHEEKLSRTKREWPSTKIIRKIKKWSEKSISGGERRKYSNWFMIFFRLHNLFYLITFTYVIIYTGLYTDNTPKTHQLMKSRNWFAINFHYNLDIWSIKIQF